MARSGAAAMQDFPGGNPDPQQLQATMLAVEKSLLQNLVDPSGLEKVINTLCSSLMPYRACRFILETSLIPNARFRAAGVIGDAAIREWGILTDENKRSLILYCLNYVLEHASPSERRVRRKVSAVAARLLKRGWVDFPHQEKADIFFEVQTSLKIESYSLISDAWPKHVEQSIQGIHGPNQQIAGIEFLETLVLVFSLSSDSAMDLPKESLAQCQWSLEVEFLKDFYRWAQTVVFNTANKILSSNVSLPEDNACSEAFRLMVQILRWSFKHNMEHENSDAKINSGLRNDATNLKKFEHPLVKNYSYDMLWGDSPIAVSCRELIVQLCSLGGAVFPNDNGDLQIKHLKRILSAVILWIEPPVVSATSIQNRSDSEFIDGCRALLAMASLTTSSLFDNLLKSIRHHGTINLLSALTLEAIKSVQDGEETWGSEALDILLETWSVILGEDDADKSPMSVDGAQAASSSSKIIVEPHMKAATDSASEDAGDADCSRASSASADTDSVSEDTCASSASERDKLLVLHAPLVAAARAAADVPKARLAKPVEEDDNNQGFIARAVAAGLRGLAAAYWGGGAWEEGHPWDDSFLF